MKTNCLTDITLQHILSPVSGVWCSALSQRYAYSTASQQVLRHVSNIVHEINQFISCITGLWFSMWTASLILLFCISRSTFKTSTADKAEKYLRCVNVAVNRYLIMEAVSILLPNTASKTAFKTSAVTDIINRTCSHVSDTYILPRESVVYCFD